MRGETHKQLYTNCNTTNSFLLSVTFGSINIFHTETNTGNEESNRARNLYRDTSTLLKNSMLKYVRSI